MKEYLKGRKFSEKDYENIKVEERQRIEWAFTHGNILTAFILSYFVAILGFTISTIMNIDFQEVFTSSINIWKACLLALLVLLLIGFPVFLIHPSAEKYHDNIRSTANAASYIKVFYELPSILLNKSNQEDCGLKGWETLHLNLVIPHAKVIGREYFFLSLLTVVLYTLIGIAYTVWCIICFNISIINIIPLSVFFIIYVFYGVWVYLFMIMISKDTRTDKFFSVYPSMYTQYYLDMAIDFGFISKKDKLEYLQLLREMNMRDQSISSKYKLEK